MNGVCVAFVFQFVDFSCFSFVVTQMPISITIFQFCEKKQEVGLILIAVFVNVSSSVLPIFVPQHLKMKISLRRDKQMKLE